MEPYSTLEKQFQQILDEKAFNLLEVYQTPDSWTKMTPNERSMLGVLFATYGEKQLHDGDRKALESFAIAQNIAPTDSLVHFRLGAAYSTQRNNIRCLFAAVEAFNKALEYDPEFFEAWFHQGCLHIQLFKVLDDPSYLRNAEQIFSEASQCLPRAKNHHISDLHWCWGFCWDLLGRLSGEAHEFNCSLEKYRLAAELGCQEAEFWIDYGCAVTAMAMLLGRAELMLEAIELFRNAVRTAPECFEAWYHLATACQYLFEFTKEETYYSFASDCFTRASEINSNPKVFLSWGCLLLDVAKQRHSVEYFQMSCEKFQLADTSEEEERAFVLFRWGQAELFWGIQEERLDLLRSAEAKFILSLSINSEDAEVWQYYGTCLNELGRYFEDESFYWQAIEKFQYALTIDAKRSMLWYGLALSHFALGELNAAEMMFEKSITYCEKVLETDGTFPQFWNDWGVALMYIAETSRDITIVETAIEKFEFALQAYKENGISALSPNQLIWLYNYGCAFDFLGGFTEDPQDHEKAILILTQVLELDASYSDVRYNLAIALSHLGDLTNDVESFHRCFEHFKVLTQEDPEDDIVWLDWGIGLMNLADLVYDVHAPELSDKLYDEAEEKLLNAIAFGNTQAIFSIACLYSLMGKFEAAMHYIERAEVFNALPSVNDLMHDEWLEGLRQTPSFRTFISALASKPQKEP